MTERGSFGIKERDPRLYKWRTVEALENLEYLSREGNKINESSLKSFDNIQGELQDASERITKAYAAENEKSREQAAQIAAEAGFKMDQMQSTISSEAYQTRAAITDSADRITDSIDLAALQLGYKIDETNLHLQSINETIKIGNQILSYIAGKLESIRHLMTIPNEVEALELADQARINFAIGKNDKALEITRKAMELCSTSIPVTAYHVIALASQNNGELFKETKTALKDYANLIAFKLQDKGSDEKLALLDTINMTYPLLHAVSKRYGAAMLDGAKDIYKSISVNKKAVCGFVERGLIDDECAAMINAPTIFRELHWSTTLNVLTDTSVSLDNFSDNFSDFNFDSGINKFFDRLAESNSPITRELQLVTGKFLHNNRLILDYLVDSFRTIVKPDEEKNITRKNIIEYIIKLEPQDLYQYDFYTKTLIAEYVKNSKLSLPSHVDKAIKEHISTIQNDIDNIYVPALTNECQMIADKEKTDIAQFNDKIEQICEKVKKKEIECKKNIEEKRLELETIEEKINKEGLFRRKEKKQNELETNRLVINKSITKFTVENGVFINKMRFEFEIARDNLINHITESKNKLDNIFKEKILNKDYLIEQDVYNSKNAHFIGKILKDVNSVYPLKLSDDYNQKIDEFIERVENAGV